jgi:hypothetical protein
MQIARDTHHGTNRETGPVANATHPPPPYRGEGVRSGAAGINNIDSQPNDFFANAVSDLGKVMTQLTEWAPAAGQPALCQLCHAHPHRPVRPMSQPPGSVTSPAGTPIPGRSDGLNGAEGGNARVGAAYGFVRPSIRGSPSWIETSTYFPVFVPK